MVKPNHFTCTLGQAADLNKDHEPIQDICTFIDHQARERPQAPAVAFPRPKSGEVDWSVDVYSYDQVRRGTCSVADSLSQRLVKDGPATDTVALLCPSTARFLFTWLGLIRAGYAVLLLAPQCQPAAIAHLMAVCNADVLLHDDIYEKQAHDASSLLDQKEDRNGRMSWTVVLEGELGVADATVESTSDGPEVRARADTAYLHHTSGTSTGLPKPIPQTHRAAIGVLPQTLDGSQEALFTTTPLYHGGVADLFRAWTSNAMVCLFPGKGVPITAKNIVIAVEAVSSSTDRLLSPIVYFSSVPYVLQMMAQDDRGLQLLQKMDIVGVGGAALPPEIGDTLVDEGVNLISRFGAAETGFLLSSHRDYESDKAWQYLRSSPDSSYLRFESQDDGTSELVVLSKWPHRAKTNRDDGSYATSDLFAPHPTTPGAWKYHSRADAQLTLITGKKFDPAPLEASLATSPLLDDVLIFGNGRPYPGALLFRSKEAEALTNEEIVMKLATTVEKLNAGSQDHARLARNMLVPMRYTQTSLEKSSKGTILRNKAEETYAEQIQQAYAGLNAGIDGDTPDEGIPQLVTTHIKAVVGKDAELLMDTDLFSYGVDSVASIQIRYMLQQLLPAQSGKLPLNIVEDCGTVEGLVENIINRRHGKDARQEDETKLMFDLVEQYGNVGEDNKNTMTNGMTNGAVPAFGKEVVLLTGATGALGAHLLHVYRCHPGVSHIHLLVRGADEQAARARVDKSLISRGLPGLDASPSTSSAAEITVHRAQLSSPMLGLEPDAYESLRGSVTQITHAAWSVNFRMRLRSFVKDHIAGLHHLLAFAQESTYHARLAFVSSVASIAAATPGPGDANKLHEVIASNPADASPLGYSRSKWVAEGVIARACETAPDLKDRLSILRIGQLAGDTQHGVWNASEAWPMMLASSKATGVLPKLGHQQKLDWLAVDVAAAGIVQATLGAEVDGKAAPLVNHDSNGPAIYHILNDAAPAATWADLERWISKLAPEVKFVSETEWLDKLEDGLQKDQPDHPALKLLGLWKEAYGKEGADGEVEGVAFDTTNARAFAPALRTEPVDEEYFGRLWSWIMENL